MANKEMYVWCPWLLISFPVKWGQRCEEKQKQYLCADRNTHKRNYTI